MPISIEEAKERLKQYQHLKRRANMVKLKVDELRRNTMAANSTVFDVEPGSPLRDSKGSLEKQMEVLLDLELKWTKMLVDAEKKAEEIQDSIDKIKPFGLVYSDVLSYRYISCYKLNTIADIMNYEERQIKRYINKAINIYAQNC